MKRIFLILYVYLFAIASLMAKGLSASAPSEAGTEDGFRLTFSIVDLDNDEVKMPKLPSEIRVVSGPMKSTSHSMQIINGKVSSSSSVQVTYILQAKKAGVYEIPKAVITDDGKTYASNSVKIKIVEGSLDNSSSNNSNDPFASMFGPFGNPFGGGFPSPFGGGTPTNRPQQHVATDEYKSENAFMRVDVSKSTVYNNEVFVATVNLYTRYGYQGRMTQLPDFSGFISEFVQVDNDKDSYETTIKNVKYTVSPLARFVLTPTKAGKLKIGSCTFQSILDVPSRYGNQQVKRDFTSAPVTINVKELPSRPAGFSGGVGNMTLSSELIPPSGFKANETITLRLKISGSGNLKLVSAPNITFPSDFETFSSKPTNNIKFDAKGESGDRLIDYVVVPRNGGKFTIPGAELIYFDLATKSYKTLKTNPIDITVEKGSQTISSNTVNHKEVDVLNNDINYIKTDDYVFMQKDNYLFGSLCFWLWILLPLIAVVVLIILLRRKIKENSNSTLVKHRRANKQAIQRMKRAKEFMDNDKKSEFYEEVMKALWGYISDKLNIPVSELNKENINAKMTSCGVSEDLSNSFINVLNSCEFARFAPAESQEPMNDIYQNSLDVIGDLESCLKVVKK